MKRTLWIDLAQRPVCSLKIWDVASVLDEIMSKCVVEAKAGPEGPNQVIVVK
jgi:hypothetical protein